MQHDSLPTIFGVILTLATVQSAPPKFESSYETKVFVGGSKAWALCSATNDSPIKYQWFNKQFGDTVTPKESNGVFSSDTTEGSRLIFEKVSKSHEGIYTCTAENQHGLVSKLFQINVTSDDDTGNETLSIEDVHVLNVTDSSIEFLVRASKTVEKYTIKYFEKLNNNSVKTQDFAEGDNIVIEGLIPSGLYTFQFQVSSPEGRASEWSKPQEVVLLPYTPEMILRSLSGNTLQIEWTKKWTDFSRGTIDGYTISYGSLQRGSYDTWKPISCMINIELPGSCYSASYTITGLSKTSYYEIHLKAHTKAGYGKPFITRVFIA